MSITDRKIRGFTLIELMITVSIIGILASIGIPKFADMVRKSKEAALKGALAQLRSGTNLYYADNEGNYPITYARTGCCGEPGNGGYPNLLYGNLFPKYISVWPTPNIPNYHPFDGGGYAFACYDDDQWGPATATVAGTINVDNWSSCAFVYFADPWQPTTLGQVVVNCTHTDTRGTVWFTY